MRYGLKIKNESDFGKMEILYMPENSILKPPLNENRMFAILSNALNLLCRTLG